MRFVADSSAILAALNKETGGQFVLDNIASILISTVNLSEVITKLVEQGVRHPFVDRWVESTPMQIVPHDIALAVTTGKLREETRHKGLSLGDRACLALAKRENLPALTTDKAWRGLEKVAPIHFIR